MWKALFFWSQRHDKRVDARLVAGLVVTLASTIVFFAGCSSGESASRERADRETAVRVVSAERQTIRETIDYVGTVGAERTLRVTARIPGTLAELTVEEGDRVEKGELLARVDAPELEAKLERVEAEVRRARTEREFLCKTYETDKQLNASGALASSKLDKSRKRCASGREAVSAARAKEREVEKRLDKRRETAPVSGVVLERRAEPGEHVGPGRPLVVIAGQGREVVVPVVEGDLQRGIEVGTAAGMRIGNTEVTSTVERIDERANGPGRAVDVHIPLSDDVTPSQLGRSVDVSFMVDEAADATPVPRAALVRHREEWGIYVVDDGVARWRAVERGIAEGNLVAVRPRLESGDRVVVTNLDVIRDGATVYAVDAAGGHQ